MVGIHVELSEQSHRFPGGHPENCSRLQPAAEWLQSGLTARKFAPLTVSEHSIEPVQKIHNSRYLKQIRKSCDSGGGYLDPDTYVTPTSFDAACRVTDAALSAVDAVLNGEIQTAFVLGRPPGHHAEHDHAMGFCLVNNIAVAAQYAIDTLGLKQVAIVDFDVHHGNGTQHLFYDRSDVYYISTHRYPFYPGTGAPTEIGTGAGKGYTLNITLAAGDGDSEILGAFEQQIIPALNCYRPELILVSAGFDAHLRDPLGGLNVTGDGFRKIGTMLMSAANVHASGRLVSLLEGGYDAAGNLDAISNYLEGLTIS
jgi:acetoin utilization deacetylase AcuC-like enzyme